MKIKRVVASGLTNPSLLLAALAVCISANFQILLSVVPVLAERQGPHGIAGAATASLSIGAVIGELSAPWLMGRLRSRSLLVAGELITAGASIVYVNSNLTTASIIAAAWARGLGMGVAIVVSVALLSQITPPNRRGSSIGRYGLALSLPSIFMPSLGVYLLSYGRSDIDALIGFASGTVGALIALLISDHPVPLLQKSEGLLATLRQPAVLIVFAGFVLASSSFGGVVTYVPIALPLSGLGSSASFLLVAGVSRAVSRWLAGPLGDRWPIRQMLIAATAFSSIGLVLLAVHGGGAVVVAAALAYGCGYGAIQTIAFLAISRHASRSMGAVSALWNSGTDLGSALGGALMGVGAAHLGYGWAVWVLPAMVLIAGPLFFAVRGPLEGARPASVR